MKKKIFVRPVSINLQMMYFGRFANTKKEEISMSDYVREAIEEKLQK